MAELYLMEARLTLRILLSMAFGVATTNGMLTREIQFICLPWPELAAADRQVKRDEPDVDGDRIVVFFFLT